METEYLVLWTAEAKIQYNDILLFWAENNRIVILRNFSMYYRIIEAEKEVQIITFVDNRSNPKKLKF